MLPDPNKEKRDNAYFTLAGKVLLGQIEQTDLHIAKLLVQYGYDDSWLKEIAESSATLYKIQNTAQQEIIYQANESSAPKDWDNDDYLECDWED